MQLFDFTMTHSAVSTVEATEVVASAKIYVALLKTCYSLQNFTLQISNSFRRRLQIIAITISSLLTQNAPQTVWWPGSARTHNKQTVCLLLGLNSKYAARTPRELTGCVSCYNPSLKYGPVSSSSLCPLSLPTPKIMAKFLWINPSVSLFTVTPENQQ